MLRRDAGNQLRRRGNRIGHHQRQRAFSRTAVKQHHRQLFAEFQVVGIAVHTGGDDQAVNLAGNHVIDHHALLTGVFIGTGDQQLDARFAAQHLQLMGKDRKAVVGDLRHHQADGVAAVIAQRAGVNARLIVLLAGNRQYALARFLRHPQLLATTVQHQAGGRFGNARQFGDIFNGYAFGFHYDAMSLKAKRLFYHACSQRPVAECIRRAAGENQLRRIIREAAAAHHPLAVVDENLHA